MNILNIIETIYESKWFPTILLISIIILVVLFIAVILLGMKDAKKDKQPVKEKIQDLKDVTFEKTNEKEIISEDVTFEIPVLTKNLENFKKILEEEIEREEKVNVIKEMSKEESKKQTKVLDKEEIDNTDVIPLINIDNKEEPKKETIKKELKEEPPRPPKREILKELFKDRKPKNVEPPKIKPDEKPTTKEQTQRIDNPEKVILEKKQTNEIQKEDTNMKTKQTKYFGDDDF